MVGCDLVMLSHLGSSGMLIPGSRSEELTPHSQLSLVFDNFFFLPKGSLCRAIASSLLEMHCCMLCCLQLAREGITRGHPSLLNSSC